MAGILPPANPGLSQYSEPWPEAGKFAAQEIQKMAVLIGNLIWSVGGQAVPVTMVSGGANGGLAEFIDSSGNVVAAQNTFANVNASSTDAVLVPAVAGKKIVILALAMVAGATATNLTFNSKGSGTGTPVSALFANAANGGAVLPYNAAGWFQSRVAGEGISVTTGAGSATGIQVTYVAI